MADVTVNVTGLQAIVNPTTWNASRIGWGQGSWNQGGSVDQNILQGWGHVNWGQADWGDSDTYETGWGRDTWGSQVWGGTYNVTINVSGVQSSTAIGSVNTIANADVLPSGIEATFDIGSPTISGTANLSLTGIEATTSLGTVVTNANADVLPTGQAANSSIGSVTVTANADIAITGEEATTALGTVVLPNETVLIDGVSATSNVGSPVVESGVIVAVSGVSATVSQGTAIAPNEDVSLSGFEITSSLGTPTVTANADVLPTGLSATFSVGSIDPADQVIGINGALTTGGETFECLADAAISTAESKFGGSSLGLDGTGDRIQGLQDVELGTDNWTWETFAYFNNFDSSVCIWDGGENVGFNPNPVVYITPTNLQLSFAGGTYINAAHGMSASQWHHIAITRNSGTVTAYIDGTSIGSQSIGVVLDCPPSEHVLGGNYAGTFTMDGFLDESRLTKRVIYTGNFTPPTSEFSVGSNDIWVLHYDGANGSTNIVNSVPSRFVFELSTNTGSVTVKDQVVGLTGLEATVSLTNPFIIHYQDVDTGSNTAYSGVSTGSNTSYSNVATGSNTSYSDAA